MFKISYIYDLIDNISPQLKKIQSNLEITNNKIRSSAQSISNSFDNIGQSLNKTGQSFRNIGSTLAPLSVATGLIGTKAFNAAAEFEMLRIRMDVLTGSTEMGAKAFDAVTQYAAKTPFQIADISKSLNMLMSTGGMGFDEAMKSIKVLGDIASISGGEMSGMALAFSQTSASTRLLGQDFNQFVNNSVPLMKILKDSTGKTSAQIMQMKEDGALSFDVVAKAMEKATKTGGLFENGAERMSKTLSGLFSTLKDSVNIAFGELGTEMAKAINLSDKIMGITDFISKLTEKFKSLSPETKKFITYAILITTALTPVILIIGSLIGILGLAFTGLSTLAGGFLLLTTPLGLITAGILGLGAVIYSLKDSFVIVYDFFKDVFIGIFDSIENKIKNILETITSFRIEASNLFKSIGLDQLSNFILPDANQINNLNLQSQPLEQSIIQPQQFMAGGQLDVNIKGLPKGSNAGFTPRPNNFLPVGVNSVFAGI
jgi:tape measure domain-containing protein